MALCLLVLNVSGKTAMFKFIEGLPDNVMAIEAVGKVTHEDYRDTLIPKAEAMMAGGPIRMLCMLGKDFTGFELEAMWDDGMFGMKHWRDFSHIAVVTDEGWIRAAVTMFIPFFSADVRLFGLAELPAAGEWISHAKDQA